jgi:hypothetical protein
MFAGMRHFGCHPARSIALAAVLALGVGGRSEAAPKVDLAELVKNPAAFEKHLAACAAGYGGANRDLMSSLGKIERIEPLAGRLLTEQAHVIGKKARAYVRFKADGSCDAVPVVGKPAGFARGDFGRGARNAYILHPPDCGESYCPAAVSLKTEDDKLVDVVFLPDECQGKASADRIALFGTHDSLKVGCWGAAGADGHRTDYLLDAGMQPLAIVFESFAGVAWVQIDDSKPNLRCTARPPYEILATTTGASPVLTVSRKPTDEEYERVKDKVEGRSGGCDATAVWFRHTYDAAKRTFVPSGTGRFAVVGKLCTCRKQP